MLQAGAIRDAKSYDEEGLQLVRWHKVAINAAMSPSSVLTLANNSKMCLDSETRLHVKGVMEEVLGAAPTILGRPFPKSMATSDQLLGSLERSGATKSSMLMDWENGNDMEVEVILGNPIRITRAKGIEMPRTQSLYALTKLKQNQRASMMENKM